MSREKILEDLQRIFDESVEQLMCESGDFVGKVSFDTLADYIIQREKIAHIDGMIKAHNHNMLSARACKKALEQQREEMG